jgi:hypothetical protein
MMLLGLTDPRTRRSPGSPAPGRQLSLGRCSGAGRQRADGNALTATYRRPGGDL